MATTLSLTQRTNQVLDAIGPCPYVAAVSTDGFGKRVTTTITLKSLDIPGELQLVGLLRPLDGVFYVATGAHASTEGEPPVSRLVVTWTEAAR